MADNDVQNAVIRHAQRDMTNIPTASHDVPQVQGAKLGKGHAMGMLRLGAHELTQALNAFPDTNIRAMEKPGVFGNENAPQRVQEQSYEDRLNEAAQHGLSMNQNKDRGRDR